MVVEYRLIITATFANAADRDAAKNALKKQVVNYANNNPGKLKRADVTADDYFIHDNNVTEKVV